MVGPRHRWTPVRRRTVNIGPAEGASTSGWQALRVNLPNYIQDVTVFPVDGADPNYYYSGQGNDIETTMRRSLGSALGSDTELTFRTQYDIEEDWDYAYVEYSDDDGATWHSADGDLSTSTNPNGQNQGLGITGTTAWMGRRDVHDPGRRHRHRVPILDRRRGGPAGLRGRLDPVER